MSYNQGSFQQSNKLCCLCCCFSACFLVLSGAAKHKKATVIHQRPVAKVNLTVSFCPIAQLVDRSVLTSTAGIFRQTHLVDWRKGDQ